MTKIISVHFLRRVARVKERRLQRLFTGSPVTASVLQQAGVPIWAEGVRVEKAGPFQWAVVATSHRGR